MDTKAIVTNGTAEPEASTSSAMSKTTTISTIAVQSGHTRIVIALLHCGDWMNLKILEITPELTTLGDTLPEAMDLQRAHDEVLRQLKNKQSPVEELLRQADQLIATQRPRAEVYAAMAESLGRAWKDINSLLELRKEILDLNVQYHTKAQEFFTRMDELESSCTDTVVPIEIDAVKTFLNNIHDLRRALLESLMGALQAGNTLLGKLKELGAQGTLDSRPDRIRTSVNRAISQVQGWMDQLHIKRQVLEATFNRRKTQLEQCLALAILASDLHDLEDTIHDRRELLASTDQLGDSTSSAELLLHEHKKLLPEAKQLQERALKITKATEQLVASGCFAGEQATQQSYAVLAATSDYFTDLQNREMLLDRIAAFFKSAQNAFNQLDQLEHQITTAKLPPTSQQLIQLHAQCSKSIEEITNAPISEGHEIIDLVGRGQPSVEGVKRTVEELENRKIALDRLCVAHREENIRINKALYNFLEKHEEISNWLASIAEAFLQKHYSMGETLPQAKDFLDLHNQLLNDLQTKGNEINSLILTLPPILEYLEDNQRRDVDSKVEEMHERWIKLKNILENRLDLARIFVKFHMEAEIVNNEMDKLEDSLLQSKDNVTDELMRDLEEKWESLIPLYQSAKNTGLTFISQADKVSEPYLDTKRACLCVESVLERLSGRQLLVTRNWQSFHTEVVEKRELLVRLEETMAESTRTINWVTKLDEQLYPVITTNSTNPREIAEHLAVKLEKVLPDIKRGQNEVEQRINTAETLISKTQATDEKTLNVKNKLAEVKRKLSDIAQDYKILMETLISYFRNLVILDQRVEEFNRSGSLLPEDVIGIESLIREHESSKQAVLDMFNRSRTECENCVQRISRQEPPQAADSDIQKLQHVLELERDNWENQWRQKRDTLEAHRQLLQFDTALDQINGTLDDLTNQLEDMKGKYGESSSAAKATSQAFVYFEKTVDLLQQRIQSFLNTGEKLLAERHSQSPHIQKHISQLQDRWNNFKKQVQETRNLIDLSIKFFELVEEANEWFREGSRLLVNIARKSNSVTKPEQAQELLNEIEIFLKPGERKQNDRIQKISELALKIYGFQPVSHIDQVLQENKGMLESFTSISIEINQLAENLRQAEEQRLKDIEEARIRAEEEAKRKAEEEETRKKAEEEARLKAIEEARLKAAEEARLKAAEEARLKAAEEARLKAIEETRLKAEEEARLRAAEEARLKAAEEARLKAAEEARLKAIEEARLKAEEEAKLRAAEEARLRAEEEARLKAAEEARLKAEKEARLRAAEEARLKALEEARIKAEEEARLKTEEEARLRAVEEARLRAAEETRLRLEKETRLKVAEEARLKAEEDARHKAAEEVRLRLAEEARLKAEEEARVKAAEEKKLRAAEEARVKAAEEAKLKAAEEARLTALEKARIENETRLKAAEIARIKAEEAKLKAEQEEARRLEQLHRLEVTEVTRIHQIHLEKDLSPLTIEELETPVFTTPLSDAVIQEGSRFTFLCQVIGSPVPVVTWFKDGISIQNNPDYQTIYDQGLCSLTIEETFAEDSANYTCKAINAAGSAETNASLSVKETVPEEQLTPPTFVKLLEPGNAREGSAFQFYCKVEGNPLPTVQWFKNYECIDNSPDYGITYNNGDAILKFEKVFLEDKAEYTCKASNQLGVAQSTANLAVAPLEPMESPKFILPLSNVMARAGQKIKLECEVSGLPPPVLTWSHSGKAVKETREIKLQSEGGKATLVVFEAFPKDAGTYVVNAKNIAGETTSACSVSVKGRLPTETSDSELASDMEPVKPSIQLPLANVTIVEGNRVRLDCVIVGQPEPEVIWYHDDRPVKESPDFQLLFQGDRCSLVIQEAFAEDAGHYKVVALNSAGEASSKCMLTVTPAEVTAEIPEQKETPAGSPPKFIKLLSDILVSEGENVTFEGNVVGEPVPEIRWLLNNQPISGTDHVKITQDTSDGTIRLEIGSVRPEDKGVYTVKAVNSSGDAKCFSQLIVKSSKPPETIKHEEIKSAPVFKETFNDRVAFENTSTKFECIVVGKPTPKVKWLFNGDSISGKQFLISTSGDRQVLTIPEVTKNLEGTITCVAENDVGKASCASTLSVQSVSVITLPEISKNVQQHVETSYFLNKEIHTQSSTSTSSKVVTSSSGEAEPHVQIHSYSAKDQQTFKQVNQQAPEISQSSKIEEFHQVGKEPPSIIEKSSAIFKVGNLEETQQKTIEHIIQKPVIKMRPPKFMTPVVGKIVDQNVDVVLEGILDGHPLPEISWTKNGEKLKESENIRIVVDRNKTTVTIKNSNITDAGRYTCTAINEAGKAVSTADLVVRKTVFPPVFGRRLQAQVIKKGDRVIMEVEVTGTPDPTITWFKDGSPIAEALSSIPHKVTSMGNSHIVTIEKAPLSLSGRYMVRAVNAGGEAQSIADIAVFEPTPDTMVEVVKTVVFEDVRKHETLTSAADKLSPSSISSSTPSLPKLVDVPKIPSPIPQSTNKISSSSEFTSMTKQEFSQETKTIKLEHNMPDIPMPKSLPHVEPPQLIKETDFQICQPCQVVEERKIETEETGIETSSISKQSSLQYFVKKIKQEDENVTGQFKEISIPEPIRPEIYKKFEEVSKTQQTTIIPIKTETKSIIEEDIKLTAEPPPQIFYPKAPFISKQQEIKTTEHKSVFRKETELTPEPPPQVCYPTPLSAPKVHEIQKVYQSTISSGEPMVQSYKSTTHEEVTLTPEPPAKLITPTLPPVSKLIEEIPQTSFSEKIEKSYQSKSSSTYEIKTSEPSSEAIQMEKAWAHKFSEYHVDKAWPPPQPEESKLQPSWSVQSTLEKKWTPEVKTFESIHKDTKTVVERTPIHETVRKSDIIVAPTPDVVTHYIGQVVDVQHSSFMKARQETSSQHKEIIEERNVKPSEVIKSWPPAAAPVQSHPIRPVSVQDITNEVYLQPGSPPEIAFAHPPKQRSQSYVETIEQDLERNLERIPSKVPPGGVRTIPPPLPPKKEQPKAPPIPAKPLKAPSPVISTQPFQRFPDLEPFPFVAGPEKPRPPRVGPPPTPSKFIKGKFTDSDYESDFESKIQPKWKPSISDTEEPSYKTVRAPKFIGENRSRSVEPEPLAPSKFDHPPYFHGPPRPDINIEHENQKRETVHQIKKQTKHYTRSHEIKKDVTSASCQQIIDIKPGSPPIFVEAQPERKPKPKTAVDGYMADTDEPFLQQKKTLKSEYKHEERSEFRQIQSSFENTQKVIPKPHPAHKVSQHKRHVASTVSSAKKELVATPIITSVTSEQVVEQSEKHTKLEPFPYKPDLPRSKKTHGPPPPSPSKFVKGEFRESDYESDYEGRIPPVWRPNEPDGELAYKPVRPLFTPSGRQSQQSARTPTPPTEFEEPPSVQGPPRPKFEPIEKFKPSVKLDEILKPSPVFKPKPVQAVPTEKIIATPALQPGPPPEIAYTMGPQKTQYYRSITSAPYHNAVQTETSNVVHFNEASDTCRRSVSLQQTTKVIKFGDQSRKEQTTLEPFPFKPDPERPRRSSAPPPPRPKKFIPGEFRESDYESEVEGTRIKPKWAPGGNGSDGYHYRPVKAPAGGRSLSVPAPRERVLSPLEFDQPPVMPSMITTTDFTDGEIQKTQESYKRITEKTGKVMARSRSYEPPNLHPGTPPEYGYATDKRITKQQATTIASQHMDSMTHAFKSTTQKFVKDIMNDVNKQQETKPAIKLNQDADAQVYREETRAAQYGTKHVDPDTGLIYFKYDFGYEFGIILPGESKQGGIPVPQKTIIEPPKRSSDIDMPVYHETTKNTTSNHLKPKKFTPVSKNVKWEPTSESEMSEYEGDKRYTGSRWEPSSCSPVSLSPSLPSTSPAFNNTFAGSGRKGAETPPSCPSTPGSTYVKIAQGQARAPMFITPLRNIAVVAGQPAKFECIVQSEPPPNILWSKNGRIIENSHDYQIHYRNGVCRLTITQAYPEDAGTYSCTASNPAGTTNTTATLEVPGVPSHMYGTYRQLKIGSRSQSPELEFYTRPKSPLSGKSNGTSLRVENNYH